MRDWAEQLVSDYGSYDELSTGNIWADQYLTIDYDAMVNDIETSYTVVRPDAWTVWIFEP